MAKFGVISKKRLETCDDRLQKICNDVIKLYDFTVLEGHRDEREQNDLFAQGRSKVEWPNSKHNSNPSKAVDLAPWPIDWNNRERFFLLAGLMAATAESHGVKIRWGGAWKGLGNTKDQTFWDLPHFEIVD